MDSDGKHAKKPSSAESPTSQKTVLMADGEKNLQSDELEASSKEQQTKQQESSTENEGQHKFPHKLMQLLNDEVAPKSLWWLPDGKTFAIEQETFPDEVLDKYLQGAKLQSFVRRLHKWGFHRETRSLRKTMGPTLSKSVVSFCHELFQRDKPQLLDQMKEVAGGKAKSASSEAKGLGVSGSGADSTPRQNPLNSPSTAMQIMSSSNMGSHLGAAASLSGLQGLHNSMQSDESRLLGQVANRFLSQQQQVTTLPFFGHGFQSTGTPLSDADRESLLIQTLRQQQQHDELLLQQRINDATQRRSAIAQLQQHQQLQQQLEWETTAAARLARLSGAGGDDRSLERARLETLMSEQPTSSSFLFPPCTGQLPGDLSAILGHQRGTGIGGNQSIASSNQNWNSELLNTLMLREFLQRQQNQQGDSNNSRNSY